eukprot:234804-Rhodomonas_salina.1
MMDELQAQIHEHTWPRSPITSATVSTSQAATDPGGTLLHLPPAASGNVQEGSLHKARRLNMSSDAADAVPERQTESLRNTNAGINSMNSVVAPAQSPQTSPLKSPGPKYVTTRSLMYSTVRDQQKLNSFSNVVDSLPWLNYGDNNYKWYKGAWMPTELTME